MVSNFRKNRKIVSPKGIFLSVFFTALFLIVIGFLLITNLKIGQRRSEAISRAEYLKSEIKRLAEKNKELKENFAQAQSREYLEKVAREQLNLKAIGEEVVVISKENQGEKENDKKEGNNFINPRTWWDWLKSKF